jgi:hypothetical protein
MQNPPKNPKNHSNKHKKNIKDISFNNPFLDICGNKFVNPFFNILHPSKKKNILLIKDKKKDKNNDIKKKQLKFNMRLENIINDIKNERNNNANNRHFLNIKNTLDSKLNIKPLKIKENINKRDSIDDLLLQISKKYDLAYNNTNNSIIKRTQDNLPSLKNVPPPPGWFGHKRSSSIYIPPFKNSKLFNKTYPIFPPPPPPIKIKKEYKVIDMEINGLQDILTLIEDYPISPTIEYNINMKSIHDIKLPLNELNNMIGMHDLKDSIVDQIVYFIQNLHINKNALNPDFMHTCIYGPPGTGKTEIAKIMGKIFSGLGVLKKKYFRKVTRADLIAGYLGQTAIKTRDVITESLGGVLFIDEAYALGNTEKRDSFAKECIDTLCESLSDNKHQLMVIIAGYEEDLNKCFFAYNQGLNSRFPWRFKTDDYKGSELNKIFKKKVFEAGWSFKEELSDSWFESKMDEFPFYGRDMETLLAKVKIAHGRRVFCKPKEEKTKLIIKDINKGFQMFSKNNNANKEKKKSIIEHMYL